MKQQTGWKPWLLALLTMGWLMTALAFAQPPATTDDLNEAKRLSEQVVKLWEAQRYDEALPLARDSRETPGRRAS